ncbi:hypothetical protein [uncultured Polaribacter sp.]|uniref:hypothetical protein n=1 Tax=uncultured Polaribacter sp. TaxID=174711 RepID=UPI0026101DC5|nr:hypothetical protein [uncultured Polaribacter sp.]
MKKYIVLFAFAFIVTATYSQKRNSLKGPAHKNYKPWKNKAKAVTLFSINKKVLEQGPEFKNAKIWDLKDNHLVALNVEECPRVELKAFELKNYKPWKRASITK